MPNSVVTITIPREINIIAYKGIHSLWFYQTYRYFYAKLAVLFNPNLRFIIMKSILLVR